MSAGKKLILEKDFSMEETVRIKRDRTELLEAFNEQLARLRLYAELYDAGDFNIAKEMAVKLRVLFYNSNTSKSIVKQLKLDRIEYLDTGQTYNPRLANTFHGLASIRFKNIQIYLEPKLEKHSGKMVDFHNWWESKKVIVDKFKKSFTRKELVRELANTDGGAHVDPGINKDYFELSRNNSINWTVGRTDGTQGPINNPVYPSIRQIVYETLETFAEIKIE